MLTDMFTVLAVAGSRVTDSVGRSRQQKLPELRTHCSERHLRSKSRVHCSPRTVESEKVCRRRCCGVFYFQPPTSELRLLKWRAAVATTAVTAAKSAASVTSLIELFMTNCVYCILACTGALGRHRWNELSPVFVEPQRLVIVSGRTSANDLDRRKAPRASFV
eukprot:scaffold19235_cov61-Phaeocystis_antarctica.AAC.3